MRRQEFPPRFRDGADPFGEEPGMPEVDLETPIPILLVGEGSHSVLKDLVAGLAGLGRGGRFSCAAFERSDRAAEASLGARQVVVIATGADLDDILFDEAWNRWSVAGSAIGRIALCNASEAARRSGDEATPATVHRLVASESGALPVLVDAVARLIDGELSEERVRAQLATEQACEPLASCLEPGKLYSLTLDLLLERLVRRRGIALFTPSPAPQTAGVATRGFDEETQGQLCHQLIEEKAAGVALGQGEVGVVPWGPLHHVLARVGVEAPGPLLSVPLHGDRVEAGHVWVVSDGERFDDGDLEAARTIARRASAALATAERYHNAKERAFIDDVTGVYNARYLVATAENEIQRAARYGNPLSVLFLDLDRFKSVNDRFGHLVGSDTLRALSKLLAECVRQVDTLARYGGDEFTILLVDTHHETAMKIADRIRRRVEEHLFETSGDGTLRLTISIGVATCPLHGDERVALLDAADKAMYLAKSQGRNLVCSANELAGKDPVRP